MDGRFVPNTNPPTPNSYAEILTPDVVILGGGAFGRQVDHEGGALMVD